MKRSTRALLLLSLSSLALLGACKSGFCTRAARRPVGAPIPAPEAPEALASEEEQTDGALAAAAPARPERR